MDGRLYVLHDFFNATALVDATGAVLERYAYDAFGNSRVMDGSFASRASSNFDWETRYGAYRWDSETGLYHVRNRCLHPGLGRWISRDPLEYSDGLNLYAYVRNNPVNALDAQGLGKLEDCLNMCDCIEKGCIANANEEVVLCALLITLLCAKICKGNGWCLLVCAIAGAAICATLYNKLLKACRVAKDMCVVNCVIQFG
jgi:RHS repeat-associated protein